MPENCGETTIIPSFEKGDHSACANHHSVSLTPGVTRLFASIILFRLTLARESRSKDEQAGLWSDGVSINQTFTHDSRFLNFTLRSDQLTVVSY